MVSIAQPQPAPVLQGGRWILGHLLEFASDRNAVIDQGHKQLGDVFLINLMFSKIAVVAATTENAATFFSETDKSLNRREMFKPLEDALGYNSMALTPVEWLNFSPFLKALFSRDSMGILFNAARGEVRRFVDRLDPEEGVIENLYTSLLDLARDVIACAVFGPRHREELSEDMWSAYDTTTASIDFILPQWLPLPKFVRGRRARQTIVGIVDGVLKRRAEGEHREKDLLDLILATRLLDDNPLTSERLASLIQSLMFAGQVTTAYQATWTLVHLAQHPEYLSEVRRELNDLRSAGIAFDTPSGARKLERAFWAVDETTRMRPTTEVLFRMATEPVVFGDKVVPAGTAVFLNVLSGHYNENVFTNPEEYDPYRFSPGRREGGGLGISSFGGGGHPCPGRNASRTEIALLVAMIVEKYDTEIDPEQPIRRSSSTLPQISPTALRYRRRKQ